MERWVQWSEVSDPSESASCGCVEEASSRVQRGVVVPRPKYPLPTPCVVYAEFATAPSVAAPARYWISVPVPPGVSPPPPPTHVPLMEKQPEVRYKPFAKVDVAPPVTSSLNAVVDPVDESKLRSAWVVVAYVDGDEVVMYRFELIALKLNGAFVSEASARASWGPVEEATVNAW